MKSPRTTDDGEASAQITAQIETLGDRRGELLAHVRALIHEADADIQEEWQWAKPTSGGTPVWSHDGMVCTGESYKDKVKLTFARGASVDDPTALFNASLDGNARRAIDLREGDRISAAAFRKLIRASVAINAAVLSQRNARAACAPTPSAMVDDRGTLARRVQ